MPADATNPPTTPPTAAGDAVPVLVVPLRGGDPGQQMVPSATAIRALARLLRGDTADHDHGPADPTEGHR